MPTLEPEAAERLMEEAIAEAALSSGEDPRVHPKVGAVLADPSGNVLHRAHRGSAGAGAHAEYSVLQAANDAGTNLAGAILFVTLEPCTTRGPGKTPCATHIANSGVSLVYIGMLDPNPQITGRGEAFLSYRIEVGRFPKELADRLKVLNYEFVEHHRWDHLPKHSIYVSRQIADLMVERLLVAGLPQIESLPGEWDITMDDLFGYCAADSTSDEGAFVREQLRRTRGEAFDLKYADYDYSKDSRGLNDGWQSEVIGILASLGGDDFRRRAVIDVGVGNGLEAEALLTGVEQLTLIDVAPKSLQRASERSPGATCLQVDAEDMRGVMSASQDIYLSLRTYQSTYFGVRRAVREAARVLKKGGLAVISVANGFVGDDDEVIPGLVIPRTTIVDRNRSFEVAEQIRRNLTLLRFEDVGVRTGFAEIFVWGRRSH